MKILKVMSFKRGLIAMFLIVDSLLAQPVLIASPLSDKKGIRDPKIAPMPTPASDQQIERVLASMIKESRWFPEIKMRVEDGLVSITGRVSQPAQLDWLVKAADGLRGPFSSAVFYF